jgi:putative FmdB family regulatory protein
MPVYDYKCMNCHEVFEELVLSSNTSDSEVKCPHCGSYQAQRQLSAPAIGGSAKSSVPAAPSCGHSGFS